MCINLIDSSVDGRSYTLLACWIYFYDFIVDLRGCHCPQAWVNGMQNRPRSSRLPMKIGFFWHVINTLSYLYTVTPYLVNIDTMPPLVVLSTLINDVGNLFNVFASTVFLEIYGKGSLLTYLLLHAPPCFCDGRINDLVINIRGGQVFFNLSFVFIWRQLAALILNWLSVLVGVSGGLRLADNSARKE